MFNHDSALKCYSNGPFKIKFIKIHYDPIFSTSYDKYGIIRFVTAYILYTEYIKLINHVKPPPPIRLLQEPSLNSLYFL